MHLFREILAYVKRICYKHDELLPDVSLLILYNSLIERLVFRGRVRREPHNLKVSISIINVRRERARNSHILECS